MNKYLLISLTFFLLASCKPKLQKEYELVSFYEYRYDDNTPQDSITLTLKSNLYAQIDKNGLCDVVCFDHEWKISNLKRFRIDKKILENALLVMDKVNKDSTLVEENFNRFYCGPIIRLTGKNKHGKIVNLNFEESPESNEDLLSLFKSIAFNKLPSILPDNYDTLNLVKAKDTLLSRIIIKVQKPVKFKAAY